MSLKILAVDDSATMRAIFKMTFAGEDVELTAVESAGEFLELAKHEAPSVVLVDSALDGTDGYDLARTLKTSPGLEGVRILLLASQHHPFDADRASAAGVDDHVLKPFDTQHLIDRVNRLAHGSPSLVPAAPSAAKPLATPTLAPTESVLSNAPSLPAPARTVAPSTAHPPPEATVNFDERPSIIMTSRPFASDAPAARISETVSKGHDTALANKLDGLGLTPEQVQAVVALSREVVERVVWEVVPDLAETLIREEIKRLTAE